jgi:hypothetical protein
MAIKLENKTNVDGVTGPFPYGKIRDKTSTTAGTPVNTSVYGDFHQFFARILDKSGVIANGLLENLTNGFQYFESLLKLGFKYNSDPIIRGLLGSYTTGDLIILHGVEVVLTNSGNTATWTEGAIFYNKKTYLLSAGTVTKTGGQAFVYVISSEEESLMNIVAGTGGSTIADYSGANVKYYKSDYKSGTNIISSATSVLYPTTSIAIQNVIAFKNAGVVCMSGDIEVGLVGPIAANTAIVIELTLNDAFRYNSFLSSNLSGGHIGLASVDNVAGVSGVWAVGSVRITPGIDNVLRIAASTSTGISSGFILNFHCQYLAKDTL